MEQALVAALQFSAWKGARPHNAWLQIAITKGNGQRSLTLEHGFPLVEADVRGSNGIIPEALTPIVHLIENSPFAACDCLKCQGPSGRKAIACPSLERKQHRDRIFQIRKDRGLV